MKKKNLLLLVLIAFTTVMGYAQSAPEKTNTIIITLPDSNMVVEKITKVMTGKDYTVNKAKAPFILTTSPKTLKNNTRAIFNFQAKGADVILTGKILLAAQGYITIENKGTKGTPILIAWEEMEKVAKAFGGKVKYEIK